MPIDSTAKLRGLLGMARPWVLLLLKPNAVVGNRDRKVFPFLYPDDWRGTPYNDCEHTKASYPVDGAIR